ncbi:hypothetical protein HY78_18710 [Rhizorhabdus wittichii DC-6]|nr:hypothetical protein HY78_18710 [Rhizorhabdus wittichii DC-6]
MSDPDWPHHCGDIWRAHVLAATGRDVSDIIGPMPRRPREFAAMMRRVGVRDLSGVVSAVHGESLRNPRFARRGDIVRRGWALGICRGERAEFYGGVMLPMRDVDEAWRVNLS